MRFPSSSWGTRVPPTAFHAGRGDGSYPRRLRQVGAVALLILDDFGLKPLPEHQQQDRLFTTLNKTARPVSKNAVIALDEDDVMAICVRRLIEDSRFFHGNLECSVHA